MESSSRQVAWIALPLLAVLACSAGEAPDGVQRIERARFGIVDVATPPPDAELKKTVRLPDYWVRARPGASGIGWYRMTVAVPEDAHETWALYVPSSSSSFSVFVAGARVGPDRMGREPNLQNWNRPEYFELPALLLQHGNGVIDVRLYAREGGYRGLGAVEVGPARQLWPRYRAARFWQVETQLFWMLIAATLALFGTGLWVATAGGPLYACFVWFAVAWLVPTIVQSQTRFPGTFWLGQWLVHVGIQQMAVAAVYLAHRIAHVTRPRLERTVLAVSGGAAAALALAAAFSPELFDPIANVFHVAGFTATIYILVLFVGERAALARAERFVLSACVVVLLTAAGNDLVAQLALRGEGLRLIEHAFPIVLLVFFVVLMTRFLGLYRRAERQNEELEDRIGEKTAELEQRYVQLDDLRRQGVLADERSRLMREMHDGMGARLVSLLAIAESESASCSAVAAGLRESIDELRLVIHSLDPSGSAVGTLLAMLREQLSTPVGHAGLRFEWRVDATGDDVELSPERALHLVRIVEEAVTNVLKHANARVVQVATVREARAGMSGTVVRIADDGVGIAQPDAVVAGRGLENMRYRAAALGGSLRVANADTGTIVEIWLPEHV